MSDRDPATPVWDRPFTLKECQAAEQRFAEELRTEPSRLIDPKIDTPLPEHEHGPGTRMLMAGRSGSWKTLVLSIEAGRASLAGETFIILDPKAGFDPSNRP